MLTVGVAFGLAFSLTHLRGATRGRSIQGFTSPSCSMCLPSLGEPSVSPSSPPGILSPIQYTTPAGTLSAWSYSCHDSHATSVSSATTNILLLADSCLSHSNIKRSTVSSTPPLTHHTRIARSFPPRYKRLFTSLWL